jgi:hypothetical protein
LLAYLDDTLEPAQAKLIGQKVAESDTAQELISLIKDVTRRRRITAPAPGGPGARVDPNMIAGYLDNELSADALAEVEQLALASDVHLAEIASCHQILTLVLGEPAVVPPTAFQRMYTLLKPPESDPARKPPLRPASDELVPESKEVDETLRLGMPVLHPGASVKNALVLLGGAAVLLVLLGVAIWHLLPPLGLREEDGGEPVAKGPSAKALLQGTGTEKKDKVATPKEPPEPKKNGEDKPPEAKDKPPEAKDKPPEPKKDGEDVPAPPNTAVRELGRFEPSSAPAAHPALLLQLTPDKKQPDRTHWIRLLRGKDPARVLSNRPLVSLPGYRSPIVLDSGVRLTLWGNLPELTPFPVAFESEVVLHPSDQFDLDLTLQRGRIVLANPKDAPVKVRLRFANPSNPKSGEVWDMVLVEKGTEVLVNLLGLFPPGELFYRDKANTRRLGPMALAVVLVQSGVVNLTMDMHPVDKLVPPPAGPVLLWDSRSGQQKAFSADAVPPWASANPPVPPGIDPKTRSAVLKALDSLNMDLSGLAVDSGLKKAMDSNEIQKSRLAVRCAGAIDDLQRVIDALVHKDIDVRRAAIETLRMWIAKDRDNDYKLFDELQTTYNPNDAENIMTLLHYFSHEQAADPATQMLLVDYLQHKKVAIRELAHDHLLILFPEGKKIGYNATAPKDQVSSAAKQWQMLVMQGKKQSGISRPLLFPSAAHHLQWGRCREPAA